MAIALRTFSSELSAQYQIGVEPTGTFDSSVITGEEFRPRRGLEARIPELFKLAAAE